MAERNDADEPEGSTGPNSPDEEPFADEAAEGALPQDPEALMAEIDRLRAENEVLAAKTAERSTRLRGVSAGMLIVIGSLLAGLAIPAVWMNRTLLNTDNWVATVAPLASDPAVQLAVTDRVTEAIFSAVDVQKLAAEALPSRADFLAAPIAGAVQGFVHDKTLAFVESPQFATVWAEANRAGHAAIMAAITGRQGVVSIEKGTITLDIGLLIKEVQNRLVSAGLGFAASLPIGAVNKQIVLFQSPLLADLTVYANYLSQAALVLPLATLLVLGCAVAVAADRRRAVLWIGVGIVFAMILPLEGVYLARAPYVNALYSAGAKNGAALLAIYDTVFRGLIAAQRTTAFFGLLLWIGAIVAGPARWAVALRTGVSHGLAGLGSSWDFGPAGEWIAGHKTGLRTVGIVGGIGLLLVSPARTVSTMLWIVLLVVVYLLAVEFFGRSRPDTAEVPDSTDDSAAGTAA